MSGRASKQEAREEMEIDKPHLSGAYIRSLVKHLSTSSRNKDPDCVDHAQNLNNFGEVLSETQQSQQPQPPQKQHKKQVRRRLHTSKPYQEKLLNMAEARREIVTALKFHRATMKQAQQNQSQQPLQPPLEPQTCLGQEEGTVKSRRNPRMLCPSGTPNFPNPFSWPATSPPPLADNLNFPLPDQALGLNLNFQDFNNLDTNMYHNSYNPSIYSSSTQSSSSSEVPSAAISRDVTESGIGLHPVMGEGEMAEIRSIGEQHQMEWNDTMNLVTSARWFEFLKTMELEKEVKTEDDNGYHLFDEIMEFPTWLNATDSCLQQHLDDCYSEDYLQDPALPCMDIEEIDGMDGEWLA